jgi:hypothetical protein
LSVRVTNDNTGNVVWIATGTNQEGLTDFAL